MGICYWRIENYAQTLLKFKKRCAVHVDYIFHPSDGIAWDKVCLEDNDMSRRIQERLSAAFDLYDVIIFQRIQYKEGLALLKKYREKHKETLIIAEIDDSVPDVPPSNIQFRKFKDHASCTAEHLQISDGVICSTRYLEASVLKFNDNTIVMPNCINWNTWKINNFLRSKPSRYFRIGYVGASGHDEDLLIAYRAMLKIFKLRADVKFVIRYGGLKPSYLKPHKQIDFEQVIWHIEKYPNNLKKLCIDLALAPLRDTDFNRCKSNLKWIEWSSMGVPLLASDVEPYRETLGLIYLSSNDIDEFSKKILEVYKKISENSHIIKSIILSDNKSP